MNDKNNVAEYLQEAEWVTNPWKAQLSLSPHLTLYPLFIIPSH